MLIKISILLLLIIVSYQDFQQRAIFWFLPLLIFIAGLSLAYFSNEIHWIQFVFSIGFIAFQLLIIYLYLIFKQKTLKVGITKNFLGWGDILFFVALVPFFKFNHYVFMFVGGMIFSLIAQLVLNMIKPSPTIPLAGWLSVFYGIYFSIDWFL